MFPKARIIWVKQMFVHTNFWACEKAYVSTISTKTSIWVAITKISSFYTVITTTPNNLKKIAFNFLKHDLGIEIHNTENK